MKALWRESRVNFDGRFWQLKDAAMEPKPLQKPHPPTWFGASHPDALRRAVRHGDGFFGAGSSTTAQFAAQVTIVRQALADGGRDAGAFGIAKRVYICRRRQLAARARANRNGAAPILFVLRGDWSGSGRRLRSTRRLRAWPESGSGRGRSADPAQPTFRRGRADGAPGGRGDTQALVNAATQLGAARVEVRGSRDVDLHAALLPNNSIRYLTGNCRVRDRPLESHA